MGEAALVLQAVEGVQALRVAVGVAQVPQAAEGVQALRVAVGEAQVPQAVVKVKVHPEEAVEAE